MPMSNDFEERLKEAEAARAKLAAKLEERDEAHLKMVAFLEAKLDETQRQAHECKALLDKIKAKSEQDLKEAKRLAADERKALLDEIKAQTTAGASPSTRTGAQLNSPSPMSSTPSSKKRGLTPTSTTRGIASLDNAKADNKNGLKKLAETIYNYSIVLHEPPQVVLEALLGNSLRAGIGDLRQQVRECEERRDGISTCTAN